MIALTANALSEERERCLVAGFDAFISKPIDASKLSEALHTCLADGDGNQEACAWAAMPGIAALGKRFVASLGARHDEMTAALERADLPAVAGAIGRAPCRDRGGQYV